MFYHTSPKEFRVGNRVELHPGTDAWMMGARYGTVARLTREYVWVRLDRGPGILRVHPRNLAIITA